MGLGQASVGEGVWGLRRAIAAAGAESQLTTLWPIADTQTTDLMVRFYESLRRGTGRSAALREAQLAMLRFSPSIWAPFILSGDPSPMHDSQIMPTMGFLD